MQQDRTTQCCISGGGPAGIMLGYLMARAGIDVTVLEKWPDFFRDFRGDTIHPSTMRILDELGLLEKFLALPYTANARFEGDFGAEKIILAEFDRLNIRTPFIAMIPQWDFLTFLSGEAKKYPTFHLLMETEATNIIRDPATQKVIGLTAKNSTSEFKIHSELVVGCDGRHSTIREKAKFVVEDLGAPIDVLWFRLERKSSDPDITVAKAKAGEMMIMINRNEYWQTAYIIPKGKFEKTKERGLEQFRKNIEELEPTLRGRTEALTNWDQIKLLTVTVDRLKKWWAPGVLCIGDSAHAMSPIGGVGINLAIQDAVAAGNVLIPKLLHHSLTGHDLEKIQNRRMLPTKAIQSIQVFVQNHFFEKVVDEKATILRIPFIFKLFQHIPYLRKFPAYLIGIGIRSEHVKTLN